MDRLDESALRRLRMGIFCPPLSGLGGALRAFYPLLYFPHRAKARFQHYDVPRLALRFP